MTHYYAVIDFECTCWNDKRARKWKHEIIEFPVVFMNSKTLEVDYEFRRYVLPTENSCLSDFCTDLTGISQDDLRYSNSLKYVIKEFEEFLEENDITDFTVCTDGPWDLMRFLAPETRRKQIPYPDWAIQYLDVRNQFARSFRFRNMQGMNVERMLSMVGLDFQGRPHSGLDDARNIARLLRKIVLKDRVVIQPNRYIAFG